MPSTHLDIRHIPAEVRQALPVLRRLRERLEDAQD